MYAQLEGPRAHSTRTSLYDSGSGPRVDYAFTFGAFVMLLCCDSKYAVKPSSTSTQLEEKDSLPWKFNLNFKLQCGRLGLDLKA